MEHFEYASYWIWDTRAVDGSTFEDIRDMTSRGWQVVGTMLPMPEVGEHAGVWFLRRSREILPAAA